MIPRISRFLFILVILPMCAFATSLPSAYTELEYIKCESEPIIETGIKTQNKKLSIEFEIKVNRFVGGDWTFFMQAGPLNFAGNGAGFGLYRTQWSNIEPGHDWGAFGTVTNDKIHATWTVDGNTGTSVITGDISNSRTSSQIWGYNLSWRNKNIQIGCQSDSDVCDINLYTMSINLDNTLVFNGIPAQRKYDCAIGMYDTVSDTFFTSANTDAFIAPSTNTCIPTCEITNMMETDMCLQTVPPTAPYLTAWYNNKKYYINLSENDYPIHAGSDHKLQIIINDTTYNAHDNSIVEQ